MRRINKQYAKAASKVNEVKGVVEKHSSSIIAAILLFLFKLLYRSFGTVRKSVWDIKGADNRLPKYMDLG